MDIAEIRRKARLLDAAGEKTVGSDKGASLIEEENIAAEIRMPAHTETIAEQVHLPEVDIPSPSEELKVAVEGGGRKDIEHESRNQEKPGKPDNVGANKAKEDASEEEVEAIVFSLDNEEYGIDIHQVKEVIKVRELTDVPKAPRDIMGVISLRGVVIPVMNLRGKFGMAMENKGERIIIVRDGAGLLGLLVDKVKRVVRLPEKSIEPPPSVSTLNGELIKGIGRYKGGMFILIDIKNLLELK